MPGSNYAGVFAFAEGLRMAALHDKNLQALTRNTFTVSGGVAQYQKGMVLNDFIHLVDTRLYEAKRSGKNRVIGDR